MDDGVMQNQYIGKDMHELRTSIDSMTLRTDSIGNSFGKELINSGYFTLYNNERRDSTYKERSAPPTINIDSIYASASLQQRESELFQEPKPYAKTTNTKVYFLMETNESYVVTKWKCTKNSLCLLHA